MKKKIVLYITGIAVCLAVFAGTADRKAGAVYESDAGEKKLAVRNAAPKRDAEALAGEVSLTENIDDVEDEEKTAEYLSYYFGISLEEDGFYASLQKICPSSKAVDEEPEQASELESEQGAEKEAEQEADKEESDEKQIVQAEDMQLSASDMIRETVIAVDKEQLAYTYSKEKIKERMEFYGITDAKKKAKDTEDNTAFLVCALDLNLINPETAQSALDGALSTEQQNSLLMAAANHCGRGRNYLGYSNDADIYAKLRFVQELYLPFADEELYAAVNLLFEGELTEECILKNAAYDARFLPSLTVCYSHESLEHMEQLLGLLNSENLVAKVQLEPKMLLDKTAAKQLKEWEKEKEEEQEKRAEQEEGKKENSEAAQTEKTAQTGIMPCFGSLGYDLVLEFETKEDVAHFEALVREYAQEKEEKTEEAENKKDAENIENTKDTEEKQDTESAKDTESTKKPLIANADSEYRYVTACGLAGSPAHPQENGNNENGNDENENRNAETGNTDNREAERITIENASARAEFYCLTEQTESIKEKLLELAEEAAIPIYEVKTEEKTKEKEETEAVSKTEKAEEDTEEQKKNETAVTEEGESEVENETGIKGIESETEQNFLQKGLKLTHGKYICNKEFYFRLGGTDETEAENETETGSNSKVENETETGSNSKIENETEDGSEPQTGTKTTNG